MSWLRKVDKVFNVINFLLMGIMFLIISLQVIARFTFVHAPSWTEEAARYLLVWLVAIGAYVYLKEGGYRATVEVIIENLSPKVRKLVDVLFVTLIIIFLYYLMRTSYQVTIRNVNTRSPALRLSMSYVYLAILTMSLINLSFFIPFLVKKIRS